MKLTGSLQHSHQPTAGQTKPMRTPETHAFNSLIKLSPQSRHFLQGAFCMHFSSLPMRAIWWKVQITERLVLPIWHCSCLLPFSNIFLGNLSP
jgi:hypothetical protein